MMVRLGTISGGNYLFFLNGALTSHAIWLFSCAEATLWVAFLQPHRLACGY